MPENENTALLRRWFDEVWNQRRLETIDELLTPDAVAHDLGGPGASVQGPAAFRAAAETLHQIFGEMHFDVEDVFSIDDRVAIRLTGQFKHTGAIGDVAPTGRTLTLPVMCIVRIRDGKICEGWNFWNVSAALQQANAPAERATLF